jgi:hypothetical protein
MEIKKPANHIIDMEIILSFIEEKKAIYKRRKEYKIVEALASQEHDYFNWIEITEGAEYLKSKWKVINDGTGHYKKTPRYRRLKHAILNIFKKSTFE